MKALLFTSLITASLGIALADDPPATPQPPADPEVATEIPALPEPSEIIPAAPAPLETAPPAALPEGAAVPAAPAAAEVGATTVVPAAPAAAAAQPANPFDMALKDGRVLKSYQIQNWNKTTLTIFHSTGATTVPAHLLPDNVVKAYSLDPVLSEQQVAENRAKQVKAAKDAQVAYQQKQALRKAPQVKVEGLVKSIQDEGFVIEVSDPKELAASGYQRVGGVIMGKDGKPVREYAGKIFGTLWVTNHPQAATLVDGDRLRFQARLVGRHQVSGKTYRAIRYEKPL